MSDQLTVTVAFVHDHYEVTGQLTSVEVLPEAIFLYENAGTEQLGEYIGVAFLSDITSRQEFTGTPIDIFANKYVRYSSAFKSVPTEEQAQLVKAWMIESVKKLKAEVLALPSNTQVITI